MVATVVGSWTPSTQDAPEMIGLMPAVGPVVANGYLMAIVHREWMYSADEGQTWTPGYTESAGSRAGHTYLRGGVLARIKDDTTAGQYVFQVANAAPPASLAINAVQPFYKAGSISGQPSGVGAADVGFRANGEDIFFHQGASASSMGSDYHQVYYARRVGGTTQSSVMVSAGGGFHYTSPVVAVVGDRAHFFWRKDDDGSPTNPIQCRTLSAGNVLSSTTTISAFQGLEPTPIGKPVVVGSTVHVPIDQQTVLTFTSTDAAPSVTVEDVNFSNFSDGFAVGEFLAHDAATGELYYITRLNTSYEWTFKKRTTGGAWTGETLYLPGNTGVVGPYTNIAIKGIEVIAKANGSRVLAAICSADEGGVTKFIYTEYEISPPTTMSGTATGTVVWTGVAESVGQNGSGNGTVSWTGTAIQGKSGSVVSPGWGSIAGPSGSTDFAVTDHLGRIYSVMAAEFGGVQRFDPATDEWTQLADLTSTQWSDYAVAADAQGRIYVLGGYEEGSAGTPMVTATRYDPDTDAWSALPDMPVAVQSAAGATDSSGRIYTLGGYVNLPPFNDAHTVATVLRFDPSANSWTQLTDMPTDRAGITGATDALGRIYAIGGEIVSDAEGVQHTTGISYRFDPGTGNWTSIASIPNEASAAAAATDADGTICVLGGITGNPVLGFVTLPDFYRFDPDTGAWTTDASLPVAMTPGAAGFDQFGRITVVNGPTQTYRFADRGVLWSGTASGTTPGLVNNGSATGTHTWTAFAGDPNFDGAWETLDPTPTTREYAGGATDTQGRVYILGGGNYPNEVSTVHRYDPVAESWSTPTSLPQPRSAPAAAGDSQGRIYIAGGEDGGTSEEKIDLWRYDVAANTWDTTLPPMSVNRTAALAICDDQDRLYVIGGTGGINDQILSNVDRFDPVTEQWESLASLPTSVDATQAARDHQGRIYVVGGRGTASRNAAYRYDPRINKWETLTNLPTGRYGLGVAADGEGRIYAVGGQVGTTALDVVERFDPITDQWETLDPISTARTNLTAAADGQGRIYAVGGADFSANHFDTVERYTTVTEGTVGGTGFGSFAVSGVADGTNIMPLIPPTGLTATPVSGTQIDLSWDAAAATGYDIERDGVVIVTNHQTTSYSDTELTPNTEYDYRVRSRRVT